MIKPDYCIEIDALRHGYAQPGLKKDSFPGEIRAAITDSDLPEIGEGGYTLSQVISIITAFQNTLPDDKSNFDCLQVFEASSLIQNYRAIGDLCFLDTTAEAAAAASKPVEVEEINLGPVDDLPVKPKKHHAFAGVIATAGKRGFDRISQLPEAFSQDLVTSHVGQYLSGKDKAAFASSSKRFFDLSKDIREERKLRKLLQLLQHVVRGEQNEAQRMLKKFPWLLTKRSDVTDYSDRTFKNLSPWECMLWAMDTRYMGQMMLNCIPDGPAGDEIRRECLAQLEAMQAEGGGIDYEQPAACKALVRLDANPEGIPFANIARLFDTPDALLFWNDQFYYANKADSSVTPIAPTHDLSPEQSTALTALKATLTAMTNHQSRLPNTLEEHRLINTLFRKYPAFQSTHHCESHYDFGIIDALQTYADRFDDLNWEQRDALWNVVAKIQRLAPAHILQHYCEPHRPFCPAPNFKADKFEREGWFYHCKWYDLSKLFSDRALNSDFGFQFGIIRLAWGDGGESLGFQASGRALRTRECVADLAALRRLCEVRTNDARLLQDQLHQSLVPAPSGPTGGGRRSELM